MISQAQKQLQNQKPHKNQQPASVFASAPQDELKNLAMMMQQLFARSADSRQIIELGYNRHQHQDGKHVQWPKHQVC